MLHSSLISTSVNAGDEPTALSGTKGISGASLTPEYKEITLPSREAYRPQVIDMESIEQKLSIPSDGAPFRAVLPVSYMGVRLCSRTQLWHTLAWRLRQGPRLT